MQELDNRNTDWIYTYSSNKLEKIKRHKENKIKQLSRLIEEFRRDCAEIEGVIRQRKALNGIKNRNANNPKANIY